jgi:protoporphyrinogen IX oxidase
VLIVTSILTVVLWKPSLAALSLPEWLMRPGGLAELLGLDQWSSDMRMPTP